MWQTFVARVATTAAVDNYVLYISGYPVDDSYRKIITELEPCRNKLHCAFYGSLGLLG